jgi:RNA polymerase sigma-70 factor (ECF subfamily)
LGLEGPFRELYELYKDRVYNVCYRITGNAADALDASQETFGILFR